MAQKKQTQTEKLILGLIIIVGLVGGYFYYSSSDRIAGVELNPPTIGKDLEKIKNITFDFTIFDKISFKELKIFGEFPVPMGDEGKQDLFAPF